MMFYVEMFCYGFLVVCVVLLVMGNKDTARKLLNSNEQLARINKSISQCPQMDQEMLDRMTTQSRLIAEHQEMEGKFGLWFRSNHLPQVPDTGGPWVTRALAIMDHAVRLQHESDSLHSQAATHARLTNFNRNL